MTKQFEKTLVYHCSPALLGIKSANLINVSIDKYPNIFNELEELNRLFNPRIIFTILHVTNKHVLILVYRKNKLAKTIFNDNSYSYLLKYNYPILKDLDVYLECLKQRLISSGKNNFPHEIGVFLGYDLNDIIEFQNGNKNCLLVGYWKVFSDLENKKKIFNQYNKCISTVYSLIEKGYDLENIL